MNGWKDCARAALCGVYKHTGAMYLHERLARLCGQQFMTVLLFHRVTDLVPEGSLTVHPARFRKICDMLVRRFHVVPLGEVFRILRSGAVMPRRTVAITFDDSYLDNLDAARVLHSFGLPATFFIPTAFIGTERVFDWDRGLPPMPNLTWDDVREMARLGFEIGSHTVSHANLGAVSADQAHAELAQSKATIEARLERRVRWFAYPFGGQHHLRPEYLTLIKQTGYEGTVSAFGGFVTPGTDPRVLPREAVPDFHSLLHLEMHMSGCTHWLHELRGRNARHARVPWAPPPPPAPPEQATASGLAEGAASQRAVCAGPVSH